MTRHPRVSMRHPGAIVLAALLIAGCAGGVARTQVPAPEVAFVLVRHAEKGDDDARDPGLSGAGHVRAQGLARRLAGDTVAAVYASGYRRTQATAAPTAASHALEVRTYDASLPAATLAARLRDAHATGTVLVVGHSNTVPSIAAALCACEIAPMAEDEFDRVLTVRIGPDGHAHVARDRY